MSQLSDINIHDPDFVSDPFLGFEKLRTNCPVAYSQNYGWFYVISRYEDLRAATIDWRTYTSSVAGVTAIPVITPRTEPMLPIEVDPPSAQSISGFDGAPVLKRARS